MPGLKKMVLHRRREGANKARTPSHVMPYKDDDSQNKNIYEVKGKLFVLSLSINSVSLHRMFNSNILSLSARLPYG